MTRYSSLASIIAALAATPLTIAMGYPWSSLRSPRRERSPSSCSTAATSRASCGGGIAHPAREGPAGLIAPLM